MTARARRFRSRPLVPRATSASFLALALLCTATVCGDRTNTFNIDNETPWAVNISIADPPSTWELTTEARLAPGVLGALLITPGGASDAQCLGSDVVATRLEDQAEIRFGAPACASDYWILHDEDFPPLANTPGSAGPPSEPSRSSEPVDPNS